MPTNGSFLCIALATIRWPFANTANNTIHNTFCSNFCFFSRWGINNSLGYVRGNFLVISGAKDETTAPTVADNSVSTSTVGAMQIQAPQSETIDQESTLVAVGSDVIERTDNRLSQVREAKMRGYEGDSCGECGNFTLVRNGTCLKCQTCGATTGCS